MKYFFDKPDAYEQALTDSEDDLSDDESGIIRLNNIPNLQLSEDKDEEECIGLASDELDRKISEAISIVTKRTLCMGDSPVARSFLQTLCTTYGWIL